MFCHQECRYSLVKTATIAHSLTSNFSWSQEINSIISFVILRTLPSLREAMAITQRSNGLQGKIPMVISEDPWGWVLSSQILQVAILTLDTFLCQQPKLGVCAFPQAALAAASELSLLLTNVTFGIRSAWNRHQVVPWAEPFTYWLQTCSRAVWGLSLLQPQDLFWHTSCCEQAFFGQGSRQKGQNCALPTARFSRESNSSAAQSHTVAVLHQPISSPVDFFMHRMCISW